MSDEQTNITECGSKPQGEAVAMSSSDTLTSDLPLLAKHAQSCKTE